MKPVRVTLATVLLLLASVAAADAGLFGSCEKRPGTPTGLAAAFNTNGIFLSWINKARSGGHIWWDVEVRDGAGNPVGLDRTGDWGVPSTWNGSVGGSFTMPPLKSKTTYCFRVRARDRAGLKGCVSQIWTGPVCVTTPDTEQVNFCNRYADDALSQSGKLQDLGMGGSCAASGPRWLAPWSEHHAWCMAMRGDPGSAQAPDNERNARNEHLQQCEVSYELIYRYSGSSEANPRPSPPPSPPPPPPPPPKVCAVNALLTVEQCYNLDGTPSQYYTPGSTQVLGCGTSEDEAVNGAKSNMGISLDDEPAPGSCTFSTKVFGGVCACSPQRYTRARIHPPFRVPQASCAGGMKPDATGRCACPASTTWSDGACVSLAGGGGSTRPPPAAPAAGKTCFGNMVLDASGSCTCPPGSQWSRRRCVSPSQTQGVTTPPPTTVSPPAIDCPRGTSGIYPNCRVATTRPPPCPPGTVGEPPNCQVSRGGSNAINPGQEQICPAGTRRLTRGGRLVRCVPIPHQPQEQVQTQTCPEGTRPVTRNGRIITCQPERQAQSCPAGTRPLQRNGRIIRCAPMQCPRHTTGTWPNCQSGGTQGTKPGDSATTNPRVCPTGTIGRWPRCRPPRSEGSGTGGASGTKPGEPSTTTQQVRRCPAGTFGRYPRCRKVGGGSSTQSSGQSGGSPKPKTCPAGLSGPNCDRIIVR